MFHVLTNNLLFTKALWTSVYSFFKGAHIYLTLKGVQWPEKDTRVIIRFFTVVGVMVCVVYCVFFSWIPLGKNWRSNHHEGSQQAAGLASELLEGDTLRKVGTARGV